MPSPGYLANAVALLVLGLPGIVSAAEPYEAFIQKPVSYTHLTLPTNREV